MDTDGQKGRFNVKDTCTVMHERTVEYEEHAETHQQMSKWTLRANAISLSLQIWPKTLQSGTKRSLFEHASMPTAQ